MSIRPSVQPPLKRSVAVGDGGRHRVGRAAADHSRRRRWAAVADPESVHVLRSAVCDFAKATGMREGLDDVRLAVSEAVTNSVVHAYREQERPGEVSLTASLWDGCLQIIVADQGLGYRPRLDSPGIGVGLTLIATLAHSFEVRDAVPTGAEVHMTFRAG